MIDFAKILAGNPEVFSLLVSMHGHCTNIMKGLNNHLSIIMSGNDVGKIRLVQLRRIDNEPVINIVSISQAKHMFTICINIKWNSNGQLKK